MVHEKARVAGSSAKDRPIGVFDSGVGGLTVVAALRRRLPNESFLYLGDTARLPYGTKSPRTVRHYAERNLRFLAERQVKGIVIACNTASAVDLRVNLSIPVWRVIEPGAETAAKATQGRVGVIATESTIESGAYERALMNLRSDLEIWSRPCALLVPLVETDWHNEPVTKEILGRYLSGGKDFGIDTLVLGCTHYPMLKSVIGEVMGDQVVLVDSAEAVSEQVAVDLTQQDALAEHRRQPDRFYATDVAGRFQHIARRILNDPEVTLEHVEVVE